MALDGASDYPPCWQTVPAANCFFLNTIAHIVLCLCSQPPAEVTLDGGAYYLEAVAAALGCEPARVWHWGIANRNFRFVA